MILYLDVCNSSLGNAYACRRLEKKFNRLENGNGLQKEAHTTKKSWEMFILNRKAAKTFKILKRPINKKHHYLDIN